VTENSRVGHGYSAGGAGSARTDARAAARRRYPAAGEPAGVRVADTGRSSGRGYNPFPDGLPPSRRRKWPYMLVAVSLCVMLVGGYAIYRNVQANPAPANSSAPPSPGVSRSATSVVSSPPLSSPSSVSGSPSAIAITAQRSDGLLAWLGAIGGFLAGLGALAGGIAALRRSW